MPEKRDCILLLPAAGQGLRMGGDQKKTYMLLAGKPVIVHTLQTCLQAAVFSRILILVSPGEENYFQENINKPYLGGNKYITSFPGGISRQDSVFRGLKALFDTIGEETLICVHDAVRPLVSPALIRRVVGEARACGAATAAVPLTDTVKMVDGDNNVVITPPREKLVAVQTPQCFKYSLLWEAHCRAVGFTASDDAVLVERIGGTVRVVRGSYENLKLTTPHDLRLAEQYLACRAKDGD